MHFEGGIAIKEKKNRISHRVRNIIQPFYTLARTMIRTCINGLKSNPITVQAVLAGGLEPHRENLAAPSFNATYNKLERGFDRDSLFGTTKVWIRTI